MVGGDAHGTTFGMKSRSKDRVTEGLDSAADSGRGLENLDIAASLLEFVTGAEARATGTDDGDLT